MVAGVVRPLAVASLLLSFIGGCAAVTEPAVSPLIDATAVPVVPITAPPTTAPRTTTAPTATAATAPSITPPPATEPALSVAPTARFEVISPGALAICMSFNRVRFAERDEADNPTGADVEIAQALANALGLTPEIAELDFDQLIDAVVGSTCDLTVSGHFITQSRLEQIDMIPYREGIPHVVVRIGNPLGIEDLTDLCGHTFGVVAGTVYVDMVNGTGDFTGSGLDDQCQAAAAAAVDLHEYADQQSAEDAISAGEVDAYAGNDFIVRDRPGEFEWAVELPRIRNGMGHRLDSPVLDEALRTAMRAMIDNGTYLEILERYGVQELALTVRP